MLNLYGYDPAHPPPPPNDACSREDLFTVSAPDSITCQSAGLRPPLLGSHWLRSELPDTKQPASSCPCCPDPPLQAPTVNNEWFPNCLSRFRFVCNCTGKSKNEMCPLYTHSYLTFYRCFNYNSKPYFILRGWQIKVWEFEVCMYLMKILLYYCIVVRFPSEWSTSHSQQFL